MAGALFTYEVEGRSALVRAQRRLGRLDQVIDKDIASAIAGLLEAQTRRRILSEKTAPDGKAWARWSDGYAKTRGAADSLLVASHALEKSVKGGVKGRDAYVLADTVYAAVHQYGHKHTPARPYLGISAANEIEIQDTLRSVLEEALEDSGPHTRRGKIFRNGGF